MILIRPIAISGILTALFLGAASCSNGPTGPVAPTTVDSPQTPVKLHPGLAGAVSVPANPSPAQAFSWTQDGHLRYDFQLQNKTAQRFFLRVKATFFDENRTVVEDQLPQRYPFNEFEIKNISVICSNDLGKKVEVQVSPAD